MAASGPLAEGKDGYDDDVRRSNQSFYLTKCSVLILFLLPRFISLSYSSLWGLIPTQTRYFTFRWASRFGFAHW